MSAMRKVTLNIYYGNRVSVVVRVLSGKLDAAFFVRLKQALQST